MSVQNAAGGVVSLPDQVGQGLVEGPVAGLEPGRIGAKARNQTVESSVGFRWRGGAQLHRCLSGTEQKQMQIPFQADWRHTRAHTHAQKRTF